MTIRANANPKFLLKYLIIGLAATGYGLWATYDGFVAYPAKIPISKTWEELKADESLDDGERDKKYKEIAAENGWPSKHPSKKVKEIKSDILFNYMLMVVCLGIGIPCLVWYFRNKGSWIELEDQTVRNSRGQELQIDSITQFNKKKWEKKGIGILSYESSDGPNKFVVDDLKYDRELTDTIVREIESRIPREMITGGEPEVAQTVPTDAKNSNEDD